MPKLYRQISYGIDEIIQKCGADIHSTEDWETIFLLLKTAGAGLILEKTVENREIVGDGDNISCATSETDLSQRNRSQKTFSKAYPLKIWISTVELFKVVFLILRVKVEMLLTAATLRIVMTSQLKY